MHRCSPASLGRGSQVAELDDPRARVRDLCETVDRSMTPSSMLSWSAARVEHEQHSAVLGLASRTQFLFFVP